MDIKVSFAVAIYNVAPYIEECVRGLYEQTLEDIEIILVDDCTPDDSIDIALRVLEEYPNRKSQVRVLRHEKNKGISETKKDGILAATGEYVIIIDGDDWMDRRMAELMYAKAEEADADMVICDYYRVKGERQIRKTIVPDGVFGNGENVRRDMINRRVPPFQFLKLIRKRIYVDNEVVWPQKSFGDDTVTNVVTAYYSNRIAYVNEPLYYYRINDSSISNKKMNEESSMRNYNEFNLNFSIAWKFLEKKGVRDDYKRGEIINKIRVKNRLLPIVGKCKYRRLWWNTYPEVNKVILFGCDCYKPTYKEWVWVFAIMTGLFTWQKKRLCSKRFLPSNEWI